jgi:hypothetical protein
MRIALFVSIAIAAATLCRPAGAEPAEKSCAAEIGAKRAKILVQRCIQVSPATHPPCNALNPCAMIKDEIARGCRFGNPDAFFCKDYVERP